jgi:hypothetical protein
LDTIGIISPHALKKGRKLVIDKKEFLDIPYSFIAMLVGFIDGDGYICVIKAKQKYIKICLVISLDIKDLSLLEYIQSVLKLGIIKTYPKKGTKKTCKLVINKTDLQDIFFPLLNYHNLFFLTEVRQEQYNKAIYIMHNDIKLYSDIPKVIISNNLNFEKSEDILNLAFFNN